MRWAPGCVPSAATQPRAAARAGSSSRIPGSDFSRSARASWVIPSTVPSRCASSASRATRPRAANSPPHPSLERRLRGTIEMSSPREDSASFTPYRALLGLDSGKVRMRKLLLATHNQGKLHELTQLLAGIPLQVVSMLDLGIARDIAETGNTFLVNATLKAVEYSRMTDAFTLADDSGLQGSARRGSSR